MTDSLTGPRNLSARHGGVRGVEVGGVDLTREQEPEAVIMSDRILLLLFPQRNLKKMKQRAAGRGQTAAGRLADHPQIV